MKHFLFFIGFAVMIAGGLGCSVVSAQQATTTLVTVATVNVQNVAIIGQSGNQVSISFDITNRVGIQPEIKYGVLVYQTTATGPVLVDENVYNSVISLGSNDSNHESVSYIAPNYLNGSYSPVVVAENSEGLLLGRASAGTVNFKASPRYFEIVPQSCFLTDSGDATSTHYLLDQGVDVLPAEHLLIHCNVINNLGFDATVKPVFMSYYRSVFGPLVGTTTLPSTVVASRPTNSTIVFEVPKMTTPQSYDVVFSLLGSPQSVNSNSVVIHYVLHGLTATIQNAVFDKDSYASGDTAHVSVFWTGPADYFPGSRLSPTDVSSVNANIVVEDATGNACAPASAQVLQPDQITNEFSIAITSSCVHPQAVVTLSDASGNTLASHDFATSNEPSNQGAPITPSSNATTSMVVPSSMDSGSGMGTIIAIIIILLMLAALLGLWYWWKYKKGSMTMKSTKNIQKVVLLVLFAGVSGLGSVSLAKADTLSEIVYLPIWNNHVHFFQLTYDFNLDKSVYQPSTPVIANTNVSPGACNNGQPLSTNDDITALINGTTKTLYNASTGLAYGFGQGNFIAQIAPGNYNAHFHATNKMLYWDGTTVYGAPIDHDIPYIVSSTSGNPQPPMPPVSPPSCTFSSAPSSIVVPETSNLTYQCQHVSFCNLYGGQFGGYPGLSVPVDSVHNTASGTQTVDPSVTTTYDLSCSEIGNNTTYSNDLQTQVMVTSLGVQETSPQ